MLPAPTALQQRQGGSKMTKRRFSKVYHAVARWQDFRLKLFWEGVLIGLAAGAVIVAFRYLLELAEEARRELYILLSASPWPASLPWFLALLGLAFLLTKLVRLEPMAAGSGIPQVKGILLGAMKMHWLRVLLTKFFGGVLAIGAGLSLGREGPSIQLGATVGQGLSRLLGRTRMEQSYLLTCGASAGLAAAFNAPLAGVIFSLEELHKNFSPAVLLSAMAAALTATVVAQDFFGVSPVFTLADLPLLPVRHYPYLLFLGALLGLLGVFFNRALVYSLDWYDRQPWPSPAKAALPLLLAGWLGFVLPDVLGGGNHLVDGLAAGNFGLSFLALLLAAKFLFTMVSYGAGVPGGIFLPMLVIGALAGNVFSQLAVSWGGLGALYHGNMIVFAMAAFFAASVKAPITGSILIMEMTGSFQHLLALTCISMTAYLVADRLKAKPIYEELLARSLRKQSQGASLAGAREKVLLELAIAAGSPLAGRQVQQIDWPQPCLLLSVKRGEMDLVPRGETRLLPGDYLLALSTQAHAAKLRKLATEQLPGDGGHP